MKRCKSCGIPVDQWPIQPRNKLANACSIDCAKRLAQDKAAKEHRKKLRAQMRRDRERLKDKRTLTAEAQRDFNAYIRERDYRLPCISCDKPADDQPNAWDCSHYRSVGAAPHLRFDERNAHKSCKRCNRELSGNIVEYRPRLIERIGADAVADLESDNEPARYTKQDLRDIAAKYRKLMREMKRQRTLTTGDNRNAN